MFHAGNTEAALDMQFKRWDVTDSCRPVRHAERGVRAQRTQRLVSSCYSVCAAGTCDQLHVTNNKHTQSMLPDHFPHRHINNICCAGSILYRAAKTTAFVSVATRSSYLFTNENEKNASPPLKLSLIPSTFPNVLPSLFSHNIDIMIPILISPLN